MAQDAITLLETDHRTVEQLFTQLQETLDPTDREDVFAQIASELTVHAEIEEQLIYPLAKEVGLVDITEHAEEEHDEVKQLIAQIESLDAGSPEFEEKTTTLMTNVQEHVQEEESEFFPQFRQSVGEERLTELGQQIVELKQQLTAGGGTEIDLTEMTKDELYAKAQELEIEGRGDMSKDELIKALQSSQ